MPALAMTWPRAPAATRRHRGLGSAAIAYVPPRADVCACVLLSLARYSFCPSVQYFDSEDRGGEYGRDNHDKVSLPATSPPR